MNVKALQRVDRWFGVPLCFVLTAIRALLERRPSSRATLPCRLLFVKLAEQGSTVLAYSALRRAVEIAGRENVCFVVFEDNRFILDVLDVVPKENVFTVSVRSLSAFLRSGFAVIRQLRRMRFDAAVDMEFFSRGSAALAFLSGAKQRAGFHAFFGAGPYRGNLMTHRLLYNPHVHTSQSFFTLVEALFSDPAALPTFNFVPAERLVGPPPFEPEPDELTEVEETIAANRVTGFQTGWTDKMPVSLILLNPNASDLLPLRRWPCERYVELARRLVKTYPEVMVAFTGAPNEAEATVRLVRQVASDRCVSLAGKTTLRQLLVLYTLADVLVTNDSGPAHFATLTPIEVVTLFGPETPRLFATRTPRNTVLWAGIACSPCMSAYNNRMSPCRDNQCMKAVSVDQVVAAVRRAYAKRTRDRATPCCAHE